MKTHKVKEGEHLSRIAAAHGFRRIAPIWDNPANKALRNERPNPHVLNPGDAVVIPDIQPRSVTVGTLRQHVFQLEGDSLRLILRFAGPLGLLAGAPCEMQAGSQSQRLIADGAGKVELPVAPGDEQGRAAVELIEPHSTLSQELDFVLLIGNLRPVTFREGQIARLLNLGYLLSEDDDDAESFRSAVEEFQCDNKLQVDGKCGPATQAKLVGIHGC